MKKIINLIWSLVLFIILNIILFFFCMLTISPYFKVGSGLKRMADQNNEIIFNNYKLNIKNLITREDYIVNLETEKEIINK